MYYAIGASVSSLHRESTKSLIYVCMKDEDLNTCYDVYMYMYIILVHVHTNIDVYVIVYLVAHTTGHVHMYMYIFAFRNMDSWGRERRQGGQTGKKHAR